MSYSFPGEVVACRIRFVSYSFRAEVMVCPIRFVIWWWRVGEVMV